MEGPAVEVKEEIDPTQDRQSGKEIAPGSIREPAECAEPFDQSDDHRDQRQNFVLKNFRVGEDLDERLWAPRPSLRVAADEQVHAENDPKKRGDRVPGE